MGIKPEQLREFLRKRTAEEKEQNALRMISEIPLDSNAEIYHISKAEQDADINDEEWGPDFDAAEFIDSLEFEENETTS